MRRKVVHPVWVSRYNDTEFIRPPSMDSDGAGWNGEHSDDMKTKRHY